MPTAVETLGENRVRLTVDVSPDQVRHAVDHAMSDLSESVKIPGFRKGKIPKPVLVSRLGKERIYAEAVDSHIGGWFWNAASRSRVRPVSDPQYEFELPDTADEAWRFTATVEVQELPEIVDWTTLQVPRAEVELPQETVDAEIEALRESVAELAPAGDRPARPGDTLVVDLVDSDGEAQPDTVVELGSGRLSSELESALVGASAGETKQISFPQADGTSSTVDVTVREVQEKVLPELDDELARAASEFESLAELRASIESTLREQLDAEIDAAFRISAADELVRASQVQPALPLVRTRAADLLTGFARSLERRGISLDTYLAASGGTRRSSSGRWCSRPPYRSRANSPSRRLPRRRASRCPTRTSRSTSASRPRRRARTTPRASSKTSGRTASRSRSARTSVAGCARSPSRRRRADRP